jgi:hypothetical protein
MEVGGLEPQSHACKAHILPVKLHSPFLFLAMVGFEPTT